MSEFSETSLDLIDVHHSRGSEHPIQHGQELGTRTATPTATAAATLTVPVQRALRVICVRRGNRESAPSVALRCASQWTARDELTGVE